VKPVNHRYNIYGLTIECPIALGAPRLRRHHPADVTLIPTTAQQFDRAGLPERDRRTDWFCWSRAADGSTYVCWANLCEFLISRDGRVIRYHALDRATIESLSVYLLTQVLSFSLLSFGIEALHGSVVEVGNTAAAFVGACGRGKSTLSAALVARGFPLVTDDLVVLRQSQGRWLVSTGPRRLKLFPKVARRVLGTHEETPRMNHATTKLVIPLDDQCAARQAVPIGAIYVLDDPRPAGNRRPRIDIESLTGAQSFLEIVRASFNVMVLDRPRLERQFANARRIAASVPVKRLRFPRRFEALPEVCDAVIDDLAG
jgi:hypothetical protein